MLKISRANLSGVFKENSGPALPQYEECSFLYILYKLFPIGFGKGMGRRNLSSSHPDSQASPREVDRWEPYIRVLIYGILLPMSALPNRLFHGHDHVIPSRAIELSLL